MYCYQQTIYYITYNIIRLNKAKDDILINSLDNVYDINKIGKYIEHLETIKDNLNNNQQDGIEFSKILKELKNNNKNMLDFFNFDLDEDWGTIEVKEMSEIELNKFKILKKDIKTKKKTYPPIKKNK